MAPDLNVLPDLSQTERTRYSRHLILPEVGLDGQRRLKAARMLVVGAGGLGSPVSMYLAAAGVGTIGIVDFDHVDLSNLQRQILHSTQRVGKSKLQSAKQRIDEINPEINVVLHETRLCADNAEAIIKDYDIIIDGTDNFSTRYLVNDACVLLKKPNIYGSIYRFEGQASVFAAGSGPCYRCLFPDPPPPDAVPNCAEGGVLGVVAGLIGVIQATEAVKLALNLGDSLIGRLLLYDAIEMRFDTLTISRNSDCPVCGTAPTITKLVDTVFACATADVSIDETTAPQLNERMRSGRPILLLDVRNAEEVELCRIAGSTFISLRELPDRLGELDKTADIVVYCKSGARSRKASELLVSNGFGKVTNLTGGIIAWIKDVDPTMQSY